MMDDRIVLDRKSFEALAVDTRVRILRLLKQRRKMLSEISKELEMSVSGTKEHLENLEQAGLIKKIDDGHKWKYYELTAKGKAVVQPNEVKVWILLAIAVLAISFTFMHFLASTESTINPKSKSTLSGPSPLSAISPASSPVYESGDQTSDSSRNEITTPSSSKSMISVPDNYTNITNKSNASTQ